MTVSFTEDLWTSKTMQPFIGITAHYVSDAYTLEKAVLSVDPFPHPHTAALIRSKVDQAVRDFGGDAIGFPTVSLLRMMTTDSASNQKKAFPLCASDGEDEDGEEVDDGADQRASAYLAVSCMKEFCLPIFDV